GSVTGTRLQGIVEKESRITGRSQEQIMAAKTTVSPLKMLVDPRHVAAMAAYLCSADAAVITGQDINICGGVAMQ
ncbi:MAG: SDR family oxidoreductase, partial [Sedimentisphaerales bacterium]|nr:SDR family oxidoreductase [Sedimentisphaerales bacterium]